MDSPNPGNANLPIGGLKKGKSANAEVGGVKNVRGPNPSIGGRSRGKSAIQENGDPRGNPRDDSRGAVWHSRGYLPHFDGAEVTQHVTFHLADSLPKAAILRLEAGLKDLPPEERDVERRKRVEAWIDAGHGSCVLREPGIAEMVQESLLAFDSRRYRLLAWVMMPNHVHVLFQPINGWTVSTIVASWKKFTAHKICDNLRERGERPGAPVWHREYWDRYIRDQRHFAQAISYIHQNPVKAGLVARAEDWRWSSAFIPGNAVSRLAAAINPGNANLPIGAVQESRNPRERP
jgi:REP element-mobilizing transposase RayT